jgi:hypothetical protein
MARPPRIEPTATSFGGFGRDSPALLRLEDLVNDLIMLTNEWLPQAGQRASARNPIPVLSCKNFVELRDSKP